jgi:hypothetical protein
MGSSSYEVRTSIAVSDLARAAKFYEGKLGLTAGEEQSDESRIYPPVPDLEAVVDELASTGVAFERYAWFRDSEGNLLGIGQPIR